MYLLDVFLEDASQQTEKIKKQVNSAFGIRVDQVLQGYGTTNTGNLARVCFNDPLKFSEALGIDLKLVNNIALILHLLRSKEELEIQNFETFCAKKHTN